MYPEPLERLLRALERLPGVGPRSAERMALHILRSPREEVAELAVAIRDARLHTRRCAECGNVTLRSPCAICADPKRDRGLVVVVEGPREVERLEGAGVHRGVYLVLLAGFAPREGEAPEPAALERLRRRAQEGRIREVVVATGADRAGEGAALLVRQALAGTDVRVTRLARGIPVGTRLEYLNPAILAAAFQDRRPWEAQAAADGEDGLDRT